MGATRPCYPNLCFAVDNFDDALNEMVSPFLCISAYVCPFLSAPLLLTALCASYVYV